MRIVFDMDNTPAGDRAKSILQNHDLTKYFKKFVYREDYDPDNLGLPEDISMVRGDFIVDDDSQEVAFNRERGRRGFVIAAYRKGLFG